jgi:hypothetical protein
MTDTEHGHNGYDSEQLERFLHAIDREHDELDKLKSEYMIECKGPRGRIRETMKTAKESGISMIAFREIVAKHLADRKFNKRLDELEDDERSAVEQMMEALGEDFVTTPLGSAALDRAKAADEDLSRLTS